MTRTPIKPRRSKPRRGRVVDSGFIAWCHETQPCLLKQRVRGHLCSHGRTFHHFRPLGSPKNDRQGFILCGWAHQHVYNSKDSIEALGWRRWSEKWGVDIPAEIERLNREYEER